MKSCPAVAKDAPLQTLKFAYVIFAASYKIFGLGEGKALLRIIFLTAH